MCLASLGYSHAHDHPHVEAAANMIDVEVRGNTDYFSTLYVGSHFDENHMVYDTMSDWTIVVGNHARGSSFPGNYDENESETAKKVTRNLEGSNRALTASVDLGTVDFMGRVYKETMCLKQLRGDRTKETGTFCLDDQEFLLATSMIGRFDANGIVGLAPTGGIKSIVEQLKHSG